MGMGRGTISSLMEQVADKMRQDAGSPVQYTSVRPNVYRPPVEAPLSQRYNANPYTNANIFQSINPYAQPTSLDALSAYGRQLSGQRQPSPYVPVATPVTDKLAQDTLNKLVGAKINRLNNTYSNVQAGNRPNMPAITDALATANALNEYYGGGGGDGVGSSDSGPGNSGPGAAGSLGSLGLGLSALSSVPSMAAAVAGAIGEAMADAAMDANSLADANTATANALGMTSVATMGPFGPVVGTLSEAEDSESEAESTADADSDGDSDGDGGDGDGDGDGDGGDGDGDGDGGDGDGDGGDGGGGDGGGDGGGGERAGGLIDKEKKALKAYKRGEITFRELCRILA